MRMSFRSVSFLMLGLLLAILAPASTAKEPATKSPSKLYKADLGKLTPVSKSITLGSKDNGDELPLRVTFPKEKGPYPLIVYSHGMFGSKDAYDSLVKHWASHGYVVIQPTHGDSISRMTAIERKSNQKSLQSERKTRTFDAFKHFQTRPKDVVRVLDDIAEIEKQVEGLKGKMDSKTIGMGGHSFGAHTTLCIGGMEFPILVTRLYGDLSDKRPKALLAISPQGNEVKLGTRNPFANIKLPTLVITGSKDNSPVNGSGPENRVKVYEQLPAGDKFLLYLEGATHGFGGIAGKARYPGSGAPNENFVNQIRSTSLAFWDYYLKQDDSAKKFLTPESVDAATNHVAELKKK